MSEVSRTSAEINSPYNDGFTQFELKKELWELKFHLDDILTRSSSFGLAEEEWLQELEANRTWNKLKR